MATLYARLRAKSLVLRGIDLCASEILSSWEYCIKESLINDSLKRTIMFRQQETLVADSLSISIA